MRKIYLPLLELSLYCHQPANEHAMHCKLKCWILYLSLQIYIICRVNRDSNFKANMNMHPEYIVPLLLIIEDIEDKTVYCVYCKNTQKSCPMLNQSAGLIYVNNNLFKHTHEIENIFLGLSYLS